MSTRLSLAGLLLALALPALADVGWVDDQGRVRYGEEQRDAKPAQKPRPSLASCLAKKGFVFYGASWCPQCAKQWRYFGDTAGELPYVECAVNGTRENTAACEAEGIEAYPTWQFPDGRRRSGVYTAESLARLSGCG